MRAPDLRFKVTKKQTNTLKKLYPLFLLFLLTFLLTMKTLSSCMFPFDQDAGRLLYLGQNEWAHVNCCIWSAEVYEDNSALLQVHSAVSRGRHLVSYQEMHEVLISCLVTKTQLSGQLSFKSLQKSLMQFLSSWFSSSAVIVVGSQEQLWAAVSPLVRVTSTSCVLVLRTVRFSRTGRFSVIITETCSVQK